MKTSFCKFFSMFKTLQHHNISIFKFARHALATTLAISLASSWAHAQSADYPVKPVKIIAPSAAGGGFDLVGRVLAAKLSEQLGHQFVVENRSGGGTLVGTQTAAKSAPDGYTLLVGGLSNMALNMGLYKQPGYDPLQDFVPLRLVVSHSYTLIGRKDLPFNNLKELISYSQAHPNKLNIGSSGPGTGQFILASLLQTVGKADLQIIPYKGAQPVYLDLLADRVDLFFDNSTTTRPHITNNRVKAFAVSSRQRAPDAPNIPTLFETGVMDLEMETWFGLFAPAKTPPAVVEKLRQEIDKAMKLPEVRTALSQGSGRLLSMNTAETEAMLKSEYQKWPALLNKAGVKPE